MHCIHKFTQKPVTKDHFLAGFFPPLTSLPKEILAGVVVALGVVPEAIAFSLVAGVDPKMGLFASVAICFVVAFAGGRPAMISAATAGVALLMGPLVAAHGVAYLLAATLLAGLFQILWGYLRLGYQMRFVPRAVTLGFVNAIGLLIFRAQLPQMGLGADGGETVTWPWVWLLVALGLAIIYGLPRLTTAVPSTLVAIVVITLAAEGLNLPVPRVGDLGELPSTFPGFGLPAVPFNFETLAIILPVSLAISFVGLLQAFLTATVIDDLTDSDSDKNVEARGQGLANIASGLIGGMAGAGMIGQSVINVEAGGRYRLSTFTAGAGLLILVLGLREQLARMPMAALVAVMIMVSISTFNWESFRAIRRVPKSDTAVMVVTMLIALLTSNLAIAVLVGVALAGILFSRKVAKVITVHSSWLEPEHRLYSVRGQLFFVSTVYFLGGFDLRSHPQRITIDMGNAHIWDQTGVRALDQVIRKFRQGGSQVEVLNLNAESLDLFGRISDAPDLVERTRGELAR
jgi:sulfate permease, SulP family